MSGLFFLLFFLILFLFLSLCVCVVTFAYFICPVNREQPDSMGRERLEEEEAAWKRQCQTCTLLLLSLSLLHGYEPLNIRKIG